MKHLRLLGILFALSFTADSFSQEYQNVKIAGQNYGDHNYRQWYCWSDVNAWTSANTSTLRFINWGGGAAAQSNVRICGAAYIIHGQTGASSGADQ